MSLEETLQQAIAHHQAGELGEAITLYRALPAETSSSAGVANLLAIALDQTGDAAGAETALAEVFSAGTDDVEALSNYLALLLRRGAVRDGLEVLSQLAALGADDPSLWQQTADAARAQGGAVDALAVADHGISRHGDSAGLHLLRATALLATPEPEAALNAFRRVRLIRPDLPEAENDLGGLALGISDNDGAARHFRAATILRPQFADAFANLALALTACGHLENAATTARTAVKIEPLSLQALAVAGEIEAKRGDPGMAATLFRRAVLSDPGSAQALNNFASGQKDLADIDGARTAFERARTIDPTLAVVHRNLGMLLADVAEMTGARAAYDRAIALTPNDIGLRVKAAFAFSTITGSRAEIDVIRARLIEELEQLSASGAKLSDPVREVGLTNFYLAYHGLNDREIQARIANIYLDLCPALDFTAPHCTHPKDIAGRRLRVGFMSRYFHSHSVRFISEGIVTGLDQEKFEVVVISNRSEDEVALFPDGQRADQHVVFAEDLWATQAQVAALELDVLIYGDIGMEPMTYFLGFSRLAPVQCVLQGHPVTTGLLPIDYFICSDLQELPEADEHYTEAVVRLADIPVCYQPLAEPAAVTRADYDLPADAHLYFCPQTLFKFHPDFDPILGDILARDPKALILLLAEPTPYRMDQLMARLDQSIGDTARIRWVPRQSADRYYGLLQLCEVMLDTPHFCGGNTTIQALGLGVPPVTLAGEFVRGRMTIGWLRAIEMDEELAAKTPKQFADIAVRLATDPEWRAEIVKKIEARKSELFEQTAFIRELERFLLAAHAAALSGQTRLRWLERKTG
ncbi:MAG: tetratricopeptide repeat protein [Rhodospirillaceae bacterium]|nr:tetratricopeptide repeat protein [Rhodospirillaceae bacterium]